MVEYCSECGEETGRAGRGEDSIYAETIYSKVELGPLCQECCDELIFAKIIKDLEVD